MQQLSPRLSDEEKQTIISILKQFGIRRASLFGSFARGNTHPESDIDLLIDPPSGFTLFDLSRLATTLETVLRRKVDLVSFQYLEPRFAANILAQQIHLFQVEGLGR